jgi:hypothetical protein
MKESSFIFKNRKVGLLNLELSSAIRAAEAEFVLLTRSNAVIVACE